MSQPQNQTQDVVLVKAPGGGSISHAGVEYLPDQNGHILLPRRVKTAIESATFHSDPSGRFNNPYKVTLEEVETPPPAVR